MQKTKIYFVYRYKDNNNSSKLHLQHVNSTICPLNDYANAYLKYDQKYIVNEKEMFCINYLDKTNKTPNMIKGDSGSPILTNGKKFLGVVSTKPGDLPELACLVPSYRDFIANPVSIII